MTIKKMNKQDTDWEKILTENLICQRIGIQYTSGLKNFKKGSPVKSRHNI